MNMNRRTAMGLLAATAAGTQVASPQVAAPPAAPQTPDQELESARQERRGDAQRVAAVPLPPSTEPAFHFKA